MYQIKESQMCTLYVFTYGCCGGVLLCRRSPSGACFPTGFT